MVKILKYKYNIYGMKFKEIIILSQITSFFNVFLMIMGTKLLEDIQKMDMKFIINKIIFCLIIYVIKVYVNIVVKKIMNDFKLKDKTFNVGILSMIMNLDQETIENKFIQNKVNLAKEIDVENDKITRYLINSFSNYIMLLFISYYLVYKIPLVIFPLSLFIISLYIFIKYQRNETSEIWIKYQNNVREAREYHNILIDKKHCYERNLFNFFPIINQKYLKCIKDGIEKNRKEGKKRLIIDILLSLLTLLFATSIIFFSVNEYLNRKISLPEVFIIISLSFLLSKTIQDEMYKNYEYKNYCACIDSVDDLKHISNNLSVNNFTIEGPINKIELINVWFRYPNSEKFVIKGLSYTFYSNKTYAILGKNGTGKSTLIKLITGLYKPTKGSILINGINTYQLSDEEKKRIFGILFQNPCKYPVTIRENITFDQNINVENYLDKELFEKISGFKNGINSTISAFDENLVTLSGGQWQKIFFLRIRLKNSSILILDEPTSHLDPISELDFYKKFSILSNQKINIFISHRMGIINLADSILIIDDGVISEAGSAVNLYEKKGLFYEMYNEQKFSYIKG